MAYVNMTKDFSEVRKTIPGINLTKRQIIAFAVGILIGLPVFLAMRFLLHMEVTTAVMGLGVAAAPVVFCIMYKNNGMGMEKYLQFFYETHFVRNTDRPYRANNLYVLIEQEEKLQEEVERIVFQGKSKAEIEQIKAAGESSEVKIGKKRIVIPMQGSIDPKVKKELEKAVRKAKIKGDIPESAQDTIPYKIPYEDGILNLRMGILRRQ